MHPIVVLVRVELTTRIKEAHVRNGGIHKYQSGACGIDKSRMCLTADEYELCL
jgi:uncharacterized protein (DUF779 family)